MRAHKRFWLVPVVPALIGLMSFGAAGDPIMHARVSYDAGGGMVKGSLDNDWSYATANTLIMPGDTLWVDKGGTLELEMAGGTFLRMADGSKAEVVDLPPNGQLRVWTGSFYVQRISRSTGDVTLATPACSVEVQKDSQVRVDVLGSGSTTVTVHWGRAIVRTEVGQPTVVNTGRQCFVDPGYLPSVPTPYPTGAEDDFDSWNRERAKTLAMGFEVVPTRTAIDRDEPIGMCDLAPYGSWVTIDRTPYWQPTVVVDYVPYRQGHWSYVPAYGYVWVGDYPFSYVTSHYGRWSYRSNYGWLWSYQDTWGPAWVASVRCGSNFVWSPLDPFNRPVTIGTAYYELGGVQFSVTTSSYCPMDTVFYGVGPGLPCNSTIFSNIPVADTAIWNIWAGRAGFARTPFGNTTLPMRDYSPRRVIRGPDTFGPSGLLASQRITTLETTQGRTAYQAVRTTGQRGLRTPLSETARMARVRSVSVAAVSESSGQNALNGPNGRFQRTARTSESGSGTPETAPSRTVAPGAGEPPVSAPEATSTAPVTRRNRSVETPETAPRLQERTVQQAPQPSPRTTAPRAVPQPSGESPRFQRNRAEVGNSTAAPQRTVTSTPEVTPQRGSGGRVVRLTSPVTANPPEAASPPARWRDLPVREDGTARQVPRRTEIAPQIAEEIPTTPTVRPAPSSREWTRTERPASPSPTMTPAEPQRTPAPESRSRAVNAEPAPQRIYTPAPTAREYSPPPRAQLPSRQFESTLPPRTMTAPPAQVPRPQTILPRAVETPAPPRFEAPAAPTRPHGDLRSIESSGSTVMRMNSVRQGGRSR